MKPSAFSQRTTVARAVTVPAVTVPVASRLPICGRWQLMQLNSTGSLCQVYRARPVGSPADWPADYAVKLLRPEWQASDEALQALAREAQVGKAVCHANVLPVLDANLSAAPFYIVTPLLRGKTLVQIAALSIRPKLAKTLWMVRQAAEGLAAIHRAGWRHGDVKPANIHVAPSGHVTLLDFGFAAPLNSTICALSERRCGTYRYIAPELFTSALAADARCDIYSLGVVLFELLTGSLPVDGNSPQELALAHFEETPTEARQRMPGLPRELGRLVRRMLAKQPLRRPEMGELIELLVRLEIETLEEGFRL